MSNKRLPTVTSDIPRDLRTFIDRLREILGSSGDERFVTAKELASTGVVSTTGTGALVNPANVVQVSTPANPGTITVSAAIQNIIIEWGAPRYSGHAYAEVWSNGTNDLGTAVKAGVAPGNSYVDPVGPSVSRYYWVRFLNVADVAGPFNSVNGTLGTTGPAVDYLLETLTGQITESQLFTDLGARIDLIDGSGAGSVNARIATETTNRTTADTALQSSITTLTSSVDTNTAAIQTEATTRASADSTLSSSITTLTSTVNTNTTAISTEASTRATETGSLFAKYTVKIDTNGYVSGFGLASTANNATPYSSFVIRADNFSVASPSGPGLTPIVPFVVNTTTQTVNGVSVPAGIYMDAAYIKNGTITAAKIGDAVIDNAKIVDATIQSAKIAAIDAAKITTGYLSAARILSGSLDAKIATLDAAVIGTGTITSARIGNLDASKITTGSFTADRISAGTSTVATGYTFTLGSGLTLNGYSAAVHGSCSNTAGHGLAGWQSSTSNSGWGATMGANRSATGLGVTGYNVYNSSWDSFRTFGALAQGSFGSQAIYARSWGTANNLALNPFSINMNATNDYGSYAAHWGSTASNRLSEVFLANVTTGFALVARKYTGGTTLVTEANLCTDSYSYYSTAGYVYSSGGVLPFTGVHDGLIARAATYEVGDILIDAEVLAKLDVSNSIVRFERSNAPNQKGVIGVFVKSLNEAPEDWNAPAAMPDPTNGAYETPPDEPSVNPMAYDVPSDLQVAHVNALGEGLINVCGEGGTIEKGDLIVTSSLPGKGMKQADDLVRNITVAKARETVTFSSTTEVKQIACIYMCG